VSDYLSILPCHSVPTVALESSGQVFLTACRTPNHWCHH